jgi:hypothetical protein
LTVFGFDNDFKTVNERVPLEFQHLFDSMKLQIKTPAEKVRLVGLAQELNANLGFLPKEHIFLLMKTEVTKNVLEYKFPKVRQFDVTVTLIDRLEKDFAKKEKLLNPFSQWIWRSIIAELKLRKDMGLITDKTFHPNNFTGAKQAEAYRLRRYLNYLLPWIDRMDALTPFAFNELTKEVSWVILERLNNRSLLFKRYASTAVGDTQIALFNIPSRLSDLKPEEIKKMQNNEEDQPIKQTETLQDLSAKEKEKASDEVKKATPEDMSPVSEDVNKALEKAVDPDLR